MPFDLIGFFTNSNVLLYLGAYIIGGIPFGLILAKVFAKVNIKEEGSKSIGATNVLRVLKDKDPKKAKTIAGATLFLDAIKGVVVLLLAKYVLDANQSMLWMLAFMSVMGHCFSIFLKFEGGKGVATALGVMLFMLPIVTLISAVIWFISIKTIKISSASSLIALISLVVISFIMHPNLAEIRTHAPVILIAFIVFYKHIPNIYRIFTAKEEKIV